MAQPTGRSRLPLVIGILVAVAAVGVGAFLWLTRDDAPDKLAIADDSTPSGSSVESDSLDGTWKVVAGSGDEATVAGYRVEEVFAAGARRSEAAGRTAAVAGSVTVTNGTVTAGRFEVDTTSLKSDEGRRDNRIRSDGLQTDTFPTATFELTEPIDLPELTEGKVATLAATGDLTLHGQTQAVTIDLQVKASGDRFVVSGQAPVVMADYGIDPPNVGGFVEVDDHGSFEFIVNLSKGAA